MRKISYFFALFCVVCVFGSCKWGTYIPHSLTIGGTSTNVTLSQANYRVVRNVEAVVEINNSNLRRADVEKSAFADLTRKYPLTGSQAYINVVCEEVRRENSNFFRYWFGGKPKVKQYVAVRATIIEFLQENGEPVKSVESPYNTAPQRVVKTEVSENEKEDVQQLSETQQITANEYYVAWLYKTGLLTNDKKLMNELKTIVDYTTITRKIVPKYSAYDLLKLSKGYEESLQKFMTK